MDAPDDTGRFGDFGGRFVPEALMPACLELEAAFVDAWNDPTFVDEYRLVLREFAGRPTPVTPLTRLSERLGIHLYAKREDLAHTGSHKINNVIGQTLLTKRMGKRRVIAETGAGQHGVATATAAARLGLECTVFMGEVDTKRQVLNVFRMELLGSKVVPVTSGSRTLKDAVNEAMREWVTCVSDTHYCIGSVMGPHPFPWIVREFQSIIGVKRRPSSCATSASARPTWSSRASGEGPTPRASSPDSRTTSTRLVGIEAAGGSAVGKGSPGVLHGMRSLIMQDEFGQIEEATSISAGLDYPGIGPEHAFLADSGRAEYHAIGDDDVIAALQLLSEMEGHHSRPRNGARRRVDRPRGRQSQFPRGSSVLLNLSGSRRQGRRPGPGHLWTVRREIARDHAPFAPRERSKSAGALLHGGPHARLDAPRGGRGLGRRRRRRDRHPILRSHDGRPGGARGRPARTRRGYHV
jgi:tryptophan synthase beta chain